MQYSDYKVLAIFQNDYDDDGSEMYLYFSLKIGQIEVMYRFLARVFIP